LVSEYQDTEIRDVEAPVHIGILGAGNISETHTRAALRIPGLRIAAVYGQNTRKAAELSETVGAAVYGDLEKFLDHRPMDLVAIGSPSGLHAEHARAAVRRGLHILVEKPLDISTIKVDALIADATRAGVRVGVFFQDRLKPDVVRIKNCIRDGCLGKPVLASGRVKWHRPPEYFSDSRWRGTWALDGGGALMNQGIHTVDLLLWFFGPVIRISAHIATRVHRIEVEDTATAILEFESGALGVLEASTCIFPGYPRRVELTGSEGTVVLEGDTLVAMDLRSGGDVRPRSPAAAPSQASQSAIVSDALPHQRVFEDFIKAIETGSTPACDAQEGRRSVEIVEAIYRSARESRPVVLEPRLSSSF
jgi:UDP-N-acetyl-2-amino-2-deoxyglucuronate dehydrogenase